MATQENARRFLQKLAEDDAFRARVEKDPVGALSEFGFKVDAETVPDKGVALPAKADILANLDSLGERMTSSQGIVVFKA